MKKLIKEQAALKRLLAVVNKDIGLKRLKATYAEKKGNRELAYNNLSNIAFKTPFNLLEATANCKTWYTSKNNKIIQINYINLKDSAEHIREMVSGELGVKPNENGRFIIKTNLLSEYKKNIIKLYCTNHGRFNDNNTVGEFSIRVHFQPDENIIDSLLGGIINMFGCTVHYTYFLNSSREYTTKDLETIQVWVKKEKV